MLIIACIIIIIISALVEGLFLLCGEFDPVVFQIIFLCFIYITFCDKEYRRKTFLRYGYRLLEGAENSWPIGLLALVGAVLLHGDESDVAFLLSLLCLMVGVFLITLFLFVYAIKGNTKIIAFKEKAKKLIEEEDIEEEKKRKAKTEQRKKYEKDQRLWDLRIQNYDNFCNAPKYATAIINAIRSLNPDAIENQKEVLKENYDYEFLYLYDIDQINYSQSDYDASFEIIAQWEIGAKREFVRILFKLVVCDDGIKNDEWYALQNLMVKIKLNPSTINYLNRIYKPLRTEHDYYEQQKQETHTQTTYQSGLSAYYAVLGLTENATKEDVQEAYHKLALLYHPDLPKNADRKQECEAMMAKINEAYEKIG